MPLLGTMLQPFGFAYRYDDEHADGVCLNMTGFRLAEEWEHSPDSRARDVQPLYTEDAMLDEIRRLQAQLAKQAGLLPSLQAIIDACDRCVLDDNVSLIDEFSEAIEQQARYALAMAKAAD